MVISQLPVLVGPDYELQLRVPLAWRRAPVRQPHRQLPVVPRGPDAGALRFGLHAAAGSARYDDFVRSLRDLSASARTRPDLTLASRIARIGSTSIQDDPVSSSIFWHDYETTGINPRCDRPLQVAGVRTDFDLNEIDEADQPLLPALGRYPAAPGGLPGDRHHPAVAGRAGPVRSRVHDPRACQLAQPVPVGGLQHLRFDDEVTRYSLYRNFFDPYAREWQGGNSRWDLIDIVRTAYALRPDGIQWPQQDGRTSLRLELLSKANGIDHGHAHEALSDVRATIALAR
jgi:hypothetical protein